MYVNPLISNIFKNMIFVFSGDYAGAVSNNLKLFKYYVLISLTQQLQVSALRISNIQVRITL
jgi:hypothetical protein